MKAYCRFVAIVAGFVLLGGCATSGEPVSDYDAGYDFNTVESVAIQPFEGVSEGELALGRDQVQRINAILATVLGKKGYEVVAGSAGADLLLNWHLVGKEKTAIRSYKAMAFYNCWRCGPSVSDVTVDQFNQGSFIVDMVDPELGRSVWRGVAQSALDDLSTMDPVALGRVAQAVCRDFPPQPRN